MAYKSGYAAAFPYFKAASDFAERVVTGEEKYENLLKHMTEMKDILPNLMKDSYQDWVDREIIRFKRIKGVQQ